MADLKASATGDLNNILAFLEDHPARTVVIESHTDVLGERGYNRGLSRRRADAVKSFLTARGLRASRVTALGDAASDPVVSNPPQGGRECGGGVEVIIVNPIATLS
jgi:outer membrane protein OmpA-like peptidoglycan-associated protein